MPPHRNASQKTGQHLPWGAPPFKQGFCDGYRPVNTALIADCYPPPGRSPEGACRGGGCKRVLQSPSTHLKINGKSAPG